MLKIKLKRKFKFEKIRHNLKIKQGMTWLDDEYSYSCITDNAVVRFAIEVASHHNATIENYESESRIAADYGCLTIYSTKSDFIIIINNILQHFSEHISYCQF